MIGGASGRAANAIRISMDETVRSCALLRGDGPNRNVECRNRVRPMSLSDECGLLLPNITSMMKRKNRH